MAWLRLCTEHGKVGVLRRLCLLPPDPMAVPSDLSILVNSLVTSKGGNEAKMTAVAVESLFRPK